MPVREVHVALVHLGCARNLIDSETILGRLGREGYALSGSVEGADVAVLNTCSFIGPARRESEQAIADLLDAKQSGGLRAVVVVGCLAEKFRGDIEAKFPDVDAILGLSDYSNIARVVDEVLRGRRVTSGVGGRAAAGQAEGPRLLQTPRSYAYLRPSHGCDHTCSFCIIPAIRGAQRSKPIEVVAQEAGELVAQGVREIVLVAEDSTGYGKDLGPGGPRLPDLVDALADVPGLAWLRVMYAYPNAFPWELTRILRERDNVVPYLDIPIQHASTPVLQRMRRGGNRESVRAILERLRAEVPGITLRSTVLVGHPGRRRARVRGAAGVPRAGRVRSPRRLRVLARSGHALGGRRRPLFSRRGTGAPGSGDGAAAGHPPPPTARTGRFAVRSAGRRSGTSTGSSPGVRQTPPKSTASSTSTTPKADGAPGISSKSWPPPPTATTCAPSPCPARTA